MDVRLVVPEHGKPIGGISRYVTELQRGLIRCGVAAEICPFRYLPGASRRSVLKALPVGIEGESDGTMYHLTRIQGASMLLFRRLDQVVVTVHDLGALLCPEDHLVGNALDRILFRLSLAGMRRANRIIAVSQFTKQCLVDSLGYEASRVDAIPHGVDANCFTRLLDARALLTRRYPLALPPAARIMLYVGSEQPRKDLVTLVRALGQLKRAGFVIHLLKVGPVVYPPGRQQLLQVIEEHGLTADVTFVGPVPDADLPLFYSAADLYVQPSVWEGFGLPVLEAMACGAPVVTTNIASLVEVTGDAALTVKPRDPTGLAEAIARVLGEAGLAEDLARRGIQRAAAFSWERAARMTIDSYGRSGAGSAQEKRTHHDQLA